MLDRVDEEQVFKRMVSLTLNSEGRLPTAGGNVEDGETWEQRRAIDYMRR